MATSRIIELAQQIISQTTLIDTHIHENELPQPSFSKDGPSDSIGKLTPEITKAKNSVIEATIELRQLLEGPVKLLFPESNFSPLAAVHHFHIASYVPLDSSISFAELAEKCGLLEHDLKRVVRFTIVHHRVFAEPEKEMVAHSCASKLLHESETGVEGKGFVKDLMGLTFSECWPAHARAIEAMEKRSSEPTITGYALANSTTLNTFEYISQHPSRAKRFAVAMSTTSPASLNALAAGFDWSSLPAESCVVDIGGSTGHVSIHLSRAHPHLNFFVQDLAPTILSAPDLPKDVKEKVSLVEHDMFTPQPILGADVYFLRFVFHDWPDSYCVKILRNLIPALKKGAKVVVQDHLLPEPGTLSLLQEMQIRSMDAIMLSLFNSREREESDWLKLFADADERFINCTVQRVKENAATGIIVATWAGTDLVA